MRRQETAFCLHESILSNLQVKVNLHLSQSQEIVWVWKDCSLTNHGLPSVSRLANRVPLGCQIGLNGTRCVLTQVCCSAASQLFNGSINTARW